MNISKYLIISIFAISTLFATEQDHYTNDWIAVQGNSTKHIIHKHFAEQIAKGRILIGLTDNTNIAYFGMTITVDDAEHTFVFPSLVSSSLDSKDYPKVIPPTTEMVTVTDLLIPSDPMLTSGATSKTAHLRTLLQHISDSPEHSYIDSIALITPWIDRKLEAGFMLGLVGDVSYASSSLVSQEDKTAIKTCNERLGAILHCEQMMLLKCINDPVYINTAIQKILEEIIVNEEHPIQKISLDIFTYNDMCRNCFSSCFNFYNNFLEKINAKLATPITAANFKIYISSVRPYTISARRYTRTPFNRDLYEFVQSNPNQTLQEETEETKVIQFFNPWINLQTIIEDLKTEKEAINNLSLDPNITDIIESIQQKIANKRDKITTAELSTMIAECGKTEEVEQLLHEIEETLTTKKQEIIRAAQTIINSLS